VQFDTRENITYGINEIKLDRERQDVYLWKQKKSKYEDLINPAEDAGFKYEE